MSARRRKLVFAAALLIVVAWGFTALLSPRPAGGRKNYLSASQPVFSIQTSATGAKRLLGFSVSNTGPVSVGFWFPWSECRSSRSLAPVATKWAAGGKRTFLRPGTSTNVLILVEEDLRDSRLICCFEVSWTERESDFTLWLKKIDKPMYWLGAVLGFNWDPPWRRKVFASGDLFTSNLEVVDYFSLAHAFTRQSWMQEQVQEERRKTELARINAALPPNQMIGQFRTRTSPSTQREQTELEAKEAFVRFCQASSGLAGTAKPGGASDGSQPIQPGTNSPSGAAGSRR